jgi:hypothetical protein
MRTITVLFTLIFLTGCTAIQSRIPSFWDDNQSARIVDVQLAVDDIDCAESQRAQVAQLRRDLRWFELYSHSKGARQTDVLKLTKPMKDTVEDWWKRVSAGQENPVYCQLKKRVLVEQSSRAAQAVLGRF